MEKIKVIHLGFDLHDFTESQEQKRKSFREKYLVEEDEIVISIVGRLVPVKNHKLFIDALKVVLQNSDKKIRAFIVGDGEERQNIIDYLRQEAIDSVYWPEEKRKAVVTLTSWHKDVDVVYAGSDIVALTSNNEGTPVSLIEAQAANKPIVTTRVGGITDVVIPNKTAFISTKGNVQKLAKNLFILVQDEELRQQMSEAGRSFVLDRFSYTRLVKDTSALYRQLLANA
jgi:glycosyltransferase involved in cell wall biosynthesis